MLYVTIQYEGMFISDVRGEFSHRKQDSWFEDEAVRRWIKDIDKMDVLMGQCLRDRWGHVVPPEYLSSGSKALMLMKFQDDYPVYATRCGNNCVPYIWEIAEQKDLHVVVGNCIRWGPGHKLFVHDANKWVDSGKEWILTFAKYQNKIR